jgi:hypothetical protein
MANEVTPAGSCAPGELSLQQMGQVFAASGYFSDTKSAAQAIVKILAGRDLGFSAMSAMTGVYLVKGRPAFSANMMMAAVLKSGRYRYEVAELTNQKATIVFFRRGDRGAWDKIGVSTFTEADARQAGLTGSDMYRKFPRNMYFSRAASNGCRWFCPDVFAGVTPYTPDEIADDARMTEDGDYVITAAVEPVPAAAEPAPPADAGRLCREVWEMAKRTGTDTRKLAGHYGYASLAEMDGQSLQAAVQILQVKEQALTDTQAKEEKR